MKYTIPYDDKITLPHVKSINTIGINTNNVTYDKKELNGEVIVTGEYSLDDSKDIMEFSHDIPISFLIDDEDVNPQININNFKHELIPGNGIEIMFDLDVMLDTVMSREEETEDEEIKAFQNKIDDSLNTVLNGDRAKEKETAKKDEKAATDNKQPEVKPGIQTKPETGEKSPTTGKPEEKAAGEKKQPEVKPGKEEKTETGETAKEETKEKMPENTKPEKTKPAKKTKKVKNKKTGRDDEYENETAEDESDETDTDEVVDTEETPEVPAEQAEAEDDKLSTVVSSTTTTFDTSFIPREHDRFTTYKIILLEGDEDVDSVLQARNLSKALVCNEYTSDKKVILKIDHD